MTHGGSSVALRGRPRRPLAVVSLVVAATIVGGAAGITACADGGKVEVGADRPAPRPTHSAPEATSDRSSVVASPTSPQSSTSVAPLRRPAKGPQITIAFAGDNNGEGLPSADMANAMAARLSGMRDLLSSADLAVANLETAITSRGEAATKAFTFRAPPSILTGLQTVGIDVVSMANNHGLDFGPDGLEDSLEAKHTSPIPVVGIGANDAEAFAPAHVPVNGLRIAVIGATQVLDSSLITAWTATAGQGGLASAKRVDRLVAEVKRAKRSSDIVIVFLHWGTEKNECPNPAQQELARTLAAAGTTLIVGGHAHRVQGGGFLGGALVDYGLATSASTRRARMPRTRVCSP